MQCNISIQITMCNAQEVCGNNKPTKNFMCVFLIFIVNIGEQLTAKEPDIFPRACEDQSRERVNVGLTFTRWITPNECSCYCVSAWCVNRKTNTLALSKSHILCLCCLAHCWVLRRYSNISDLVWSCWLITHIPSVKLSQQGGARSRQTSCTVLSELLFKPLAK